ncbi:MAG: hypothetical protein P8J18_05445 [Halieaceae bacterium]|nr:hypothetical protein [Halieaceae bacterium]
MDHCLYVLLPSQCDNLGTARGTEIRKEAEHQDWLRDKSYTLRHQYHQQSYDDNLDNLLLDGLYGQMSSTK